MKVMFLRFVSKTLVSDLLCRSLVWESTESRVQIFAEAKVCTQEGTFVLSAALRGVC